MSYGNALFVMTIMMIMMDEALITNEEARRMFSIFPIDASTRLK